MYQVDKTGAMYWRADGKSWKSIRSKNVGNLKLRLFQLLSNGSSVQFFRSEYTVDGNPGYVLGFYNGDFRYKSVPAAHGNTNALDVMQVTGQGDYFMEILVQARLQ